jgi:hypothetical protein
MTLAHPVAQRAGLGDAAADEPERQPAEQRFGAVVEDEQRIGFVAGDLAAARFTRRRNEVRVRSSSFQTGSQGVRNSRLSMRSTAQAA